MDAESLSSLVDFSESDYCGQLSDFDSKCQMSNGNRKTFLHMARMTKVIDFSLLELRFTFRIQ